MVTIFVFAAMMTATGQEIYRARTTSVTIREKIGNLEGDKWGQWGTPTVVNAMVVFDFDKETVTVSDNTTTNYYYILSVVDYQENKARKSVSLMLNCMDVNRMSCKIQLTIEGDDDGYLYVEYMNVSFMYKMKHL